MRWLFTWMEHNRNGAAFEAIVTWLLELFQDTFAASDDFHFTSDFRSISHSQLNSISA